MPVKAVILAGGETLGTRFRPLTMDIPKCLFALAGRPLISHIISKLVEDLAQDLEEVFLVTFFHNTSPFKKFIDCAQQEFPGLKLTLLSEPVPMGTGGGLLFFRDKIIQDKTDSQILLIHGDIACVYPFRKILEFHSEQKATVSLAGIKPCDLLEDKLSPKNDKNRFTSNYGTIFYDKRTKRIVHYVEMPESDTFATFKYTGANYHVCINGGIYAFSPTIFDLLDNAKTRKPPRPEYDLTGEHFADKSWVLSLEHDIFKTLPDCKDIVFSTYVHDKPWLQVTTPRHALTANAFFLKNRSSSLLLGSGIVSPVEFQSRIDEGGCEIGPNVTVGKNVKIGAGVRLRNCIICDNVTIGDHSVVINAIVSCGVQMGKWCRVEGTLDCVVHAHDSSGSFSNRLAILCKGTRMHNMSMVYNSLVLPHKVIRGGSKYEIVM